MTDKPNIEELRDKAKKRLVTKIGEIKNASDDTRFNHQQHVGLALDSIANYSVVEKMRKGTHSSQEFDIQGISVNLRLLNTREEKEIINELMRLGLQPATNGLYETEFMILTLAKAGTSDAINPKNDDAILDKATLNEIPSMYLSALWEEYKEYVNNCNVSVDALTEEALQEWLRWLEKKPHMLRDLHFLHKEQIITYLIEQLTTLRQQTDNLPMLS